jgi:hypothetical protein
VKNIRANVYPLPRELNSYDLDCYEMRHNNNQSIVQVHNLQIQRDAALCSQSSNSQVFVERIPYRLSNITDLSQVEGLTVLRGAYYGFSTLSKMYGLIEPYEDLICFNEEGYPKIWVNANLAENRVQK